jgi:hypothetical protein
MTRCGIQRIEQGRAEAPGERRAVLAQRITDGAHPEPGAPVRRVPQMPMIGGQHSSAADKRKVSDSNLDRLGFTKYQKTGDGRYEKTAGKGPKEIRKG